MPNRENTTSKKKVSLPKSKTFALISKTNSSKSIIKALIFLTKSNDELLSLEHKIFKEITANLEITTFLPNDYFYLQLINAMATFISPHSDLDRLTQLRLAEIVLYFSKLHEGEFFKNKQRIIDNELRINSVYNVFFPSEKRSKPEILQEKFQTPGGLKSLFLSEIETYYSKKKIALPDNESRKIFLKELQCNLAKSIQAALTKGTIQTIAYHLNRSLFQSEHQLLEKLLKAIQGFYISSQQDQRNWLEENNIPIKPSNPKYPDLLSKLYDLTNLYSGLGGKAIEFSFNTKSFFFKPQSITLTKEFFLTRLEQHLLMLKTDYLLSNKQYSAICHQLTHLMITQIDEYAREQSPVWKPYLS